MFTKILIANRGEIACRVIQTAKRMGIQTVAVYSDADKHSRHVAMADESIRIGPAASRESYLRADVIIDAAKSCGAQAIHPGYGFLSENAEFAKKVEEEGLVFIGPKHHAIAAMGDKIESKKLALKAGVNCIPGVNDAIQTPEQAVEIANVIGYPVMIKASAGGGGKGLRVALNDKETLEGFTSCRNEARNSFGDDRVFIEKFIVEPRHIEIQLMGDSLGNVVYLNERECTIQRRHQKVIEEAPSPFITDETRRAMGVQAVALAKAVNYQSAGTVEFVVGKDQSFYFLEMNTRLQVEHPVTECITGLDLVELMIRVASGEALPFTQNEVKRNGWAIECRINAEDPFRNFLPSTGRLVHFQPPNTTMIASIPDKNNGVRIDTGVDEGGEISIFYDSMIAKLIVHGRDRMDAILKMRDALNSFVIRGVSSNISFQSALLAHPKFLKGDFNTGFIADHYPNGFKYGEVPDENFEFLIALATFVNLQYRIRASRITGQLEGHQTLIGEVFAVLVLGEKGLNQRVDVKINNFKGGTVPCNISIGSRNYVIDANYKIGKIFVSGLCNGETFTAQVERGLSSVKNPLSIRVGTNGTQLDTLVLSPRTADLYGLMPYKAAPDMSKYVLSPMPGLLVEVPVVVGQKVMAGEKVAVIEAMKMENVLFASEDSVVSKILAMKGESLSVDQPIIEFS